MLSNYRKLIAAIVGLTILVLYRHFSIDLRGGDEMIVEIVMSALTALSVWWFPNDPAGSDQPPPPESVEAAKTSEPAP